ncbi:HAD family phosphatase [Halosquirtibacter laminarini]|uniref:HAD family phosphatase n=1 Tax=Halosquirtibacter laminarini TaxID=3374600 RepID=A0AC61NEF1_9BACT|nr:HAD family phosphatase [Prolixibacteraceae bacterium]
MSNKIKAVLFDMDGVLLDSMPYHEKAWCQLFRDEGVPFSREEAYLNEGRTGYNTIETIIVKATGNKPSRLKVEQLYERKKELMKQFPPVREIEGMPKVIEYLNEIGIKIGVVTGSSQDGVINKLKHFYNKIVIKESVITGLDVKNGKPHPEPYLKALSRVGVSAEETIVIENAPLGIESSVAANIETIAINTGPLDNSILYQFGAQDVCQSSEELLQVLKARLS